ncbi:MAG: 30S ribosome-binding factor RbfA [candidate division WS1 bacterium]|jgi:ribosome-binding factor A|nr:30S ribosome-binding factor RbfA [candidate division WS1 bacterium]
MTTQRMESVGRELQQEIAEIIRTEIDDPRIGFLTITGVDLSPDLRHARVYYSVLGDEQQKLDSGRGIRRAARFIRGRLAERLNLRYTPTLRFLIDETPERAQRIEQLLRQEAEELELDEEREEDVT